MAEIPFCTVATSTNTDYTKHNQFTLGEEGRTEKNLEKN
jgi:hypothetical protein